METDSSQNYILCYGANTPHYAELLMHNSYTWWCFRMTQHLRSKVHCLLWLFRTLCLSICKFVLLSDACRTYYSIVQLSKFPPSSHRWCHDIGREQAANKPLLKTVFQVTLLKLKSWFLYFIYLLPFSCLRGFTCPQELFICVGHDEVVQSM